MTTTTIAIFPTTPDSELRLLVQRFVAGDRDAFGALYTRFYDVVFRAARRILRCTHDAEDVAQWTFVKAFEARGKLREATRVKAWLVRIACNRAKNLFCGRARFTSDPDAIDGLRTEAVAEETIQRGQELKTLRAAIEDLSPRQHDIITLRIEEELSFKEISARLGCSSGSARVNFLYGVRNLKETLAA